MIRSNTSWSPPGLPTIDQLRENFRIDENDGEPEVIAKIEHGMRWLGSLEPESPYIRRMLLMGSIANSLLGLDDRWANPHHTAEEQR